MLSAPATAPALPDLGGPHVLREYALAADGERGALIGSRGDVAWLCFPDWDGDPLFAGLLGAPGTYAVAPVGRSVWGGYYEPGTLVWRSRWACGAAIVECCEALAYPGDPGRAMLLRLADALVAEAAATCVHAEGRWQRAPDDPRVDAALLLPAIRGAVPADDPRTRATLEAVRRELSSDGFVYRFRHHDKPLHRAEGAFLLCSFWLALAELQQGELLNAVRRFDCARTACGPPGLFSEEYDVRQRQLRGNLPQAFVHALMLECAVRLGGDVGAEVRAGVD